ncbi:hypothetical protein [Sulfurisphaera ohwakuensis]|uniref:Uncharacterized protein n=1 Tax=Sulfurisphaera ohwakuensis TaxID=69656 RepID=A0A650CJU3_SULOH|nr:hypothetical protein [Sulfurisphaera ohwakuensis]MBB5254710.1 hypothetical protein [Sulfurisphaera ohwakuensis]QGR18086.1 hypothetical protein D1869_13475 [Sulfurisphaera ohwakuensis]
MQFFIKKYKKENDINTKYEVIAELFSSRIGRVLDMPVLEIIPKEEGLKMKLLQKKSDGKAKNVDKIKRALAFEEWLLNIDLKEEHVMADNNNTAYIIDHGHSLSAWKPLYYVVEIINRPVTRFKLWSDRESYSEGVEIVRSLDCEQTKILLKETANEVAHIFNLNNDEITDFISISSRILEYRKKNLHLLFAN